MGEAATGWRALTVLREIGADIQGPHVLQSHRVGNVDHLSDQHTQVWLNAFKRHEIQ